MPSLELSTLNMDLRNNLDRVLDFLNRMRPDVQCLQEVYEGDLQRFDMFDNRYYVPMTRHAVDGEDISVGMAILVGPGVRVLEWTSGYYLGEPGPVVRLDPTTMESRRATEKRVVGSCLVEKDGVRYRIATTHFSWVPRGEPDDYQRTDVRNMLCLIDNDFVLCGDFNAPRGGEIYATITERLRDNIPLEYDTSIDPALHKVRGLRSMVDGVFSSAEYHVSNVRMTFGVSDHAAVNCTVRRAP